MKSILEFKDEYAWLSNFEPCQVYVYPSVEHAFQAMKTLDSFKRNKIRLCGTAGAAKRLGSKVPLRPDWDRIKDKVMLACLEAKFRDPGLRAKLAATGDAHIEEGNHWGDRYWGVSPVGSGNGKNKLGKLLMQVREINRQEDALEIKCIDSDLGDGKEHKL